MVVVAELPEGAGVVVVAELPEGAGVAELPEGAGVAEAGQTQAVQESITFGQTVTTAVNFTLQWTLQFAFVKNKIWLV